MELAHSFCIANGAPAKVAREGWPSKAALLNGQSMGTKSKMHQSPELPDAHWQLIGGLKLQITRPAKPMVICAKLCPLKGAVRGDTWRFSRSCSRRFADLLVRYTDVSLRGYAAKNAISPQGEFPGLLWKQTMRIKQHQSHQL